MSNEQLKFWITCPNCKHPFGVEPRAILQYLNRVLNAGMGERTEKAGASAREVPAAPEGEKPPAPYRPYRKWKR